MDQLFAISGAAFFLLLNAFFVLAEFAIVKVRATRLEELSAGGNAAAGAAKEIVAQLEAYLSTAQLGITIASLGLGWIGEPAVTALIEPLLAGLGVQYQPATVHTISLGLGFAVITGLHVVIGELVPKNMAIRLPETSALAVAYPFKFFHHLMFVPMWIMNETANSVLGALKIKAGAEETLHSDEELRMILGQSQERGRISLDRLLMFENLFDFGSTRVKEIMTPRSAICCLYSGRPWKENLALVREKKFTRYPLARETLDDVDGFVHFKDIALAGVSCGLECASPDLPSFRRPLRSIREEMTAERALRGLQAENGHIALVRNAKGELTGLLSMEDIVEELTGEIRDEFEKQPAVLLSGTLVPGGCAMDLAPAERFAAIGALLDALHGARPAFDREEALRAVVRREKNFSTALGHQVAFPHARLASLDRPLLAAGVSRRGLDFPSPDGRPVKLLLLILTPFNEPQLQLNILAQLSRLVSNPTLRKRLLSASAPGQVLEVFKAFESGAHGK